MTYTESARAQLNALQTKDHVRILALETSCDETAAAIIENGRTIVSNIVFSQIDLHALYGGVVPEIASRAHVEACDRVIDEALRAANMRLQDVDALAVTYGPGRVGALLTETTVQYTGDSCPMGAVNMMDSIEAAFAEKYPDLQEQYVLLPEMRSADPWSKVYRLNGGESCFAVAENYVYLSREGDVVFPLTIDSTMVAEFPVYVSRYGEQDGRITYRVRISGARPDYFTPSLTLRSGAVASFTFD